MDGPDDPVTIGAEARGRAFLTAAVLVLIETALLLLTRQISYPILMLPVLVIALLGVAIGKRGETVVLGDEAIEVHGRRPARYPWADLLEVGWAGSGVSSWLAVFAPAEAGCGLLVRPRGGRFDMPGPNAPARVATLAIFGTRASDRARDRVRAACRRHDVPFSMRGLRMLDDAPPGSPLRDPPER
jgi:hypothetical protein